MNHALSFDNLPGQALAIEGLDLSTPSHSVKDASLSPVGLRDKELRAALGNIQMEIDPEEHHRRIRYALGLGLHSAAYLADSCLEERIAVCGSGPSLKDSLPYLRQCKHKIIACNASHDFLLKNGIKPWAGIMLDTHDWCVDYQTPTKGVGYFFGSSVHHSVWQRFLENGIKPWLFIPIIADTDHEWLLPTYGNNMCLVAGATTVGLRAFNFASMLGASVVEAHGFDSCYAPGSDGRKGSNALHAHPKPFVHHNARVSTIKSKATGDQFRYITNDAMAKQILGFNSFVENLPIHQGSAQLMGKPMVSGTRVGQTRLVIAGDGAIPWMAWKDGGPDKYVEHLNPAAMEAKYGDCAHWNYYTNQPFEMEKAA